MTDTAGLDCEVPHHAVDLSVVMPCSSALCSRTDYVLGSRFAGTILPGAMPYLNRYRGNPVLITYHPRTGESKLRRRRDGARYVRFMVGEAISPQHAGVSSDASVANGNGASPASPKASGS